MTTTHHERPRFVGRLSVDTPVGTFLGDTRIRLLEAIARCGSISRAAKSVPLSYKAAWDAIDAMNNLSEVPLVESTIGGRQGGSTRLTAHGEKLVAMYRAVEQEYREAMDRLAREADGAEHADQQAFRRLLHRMAIKSSARNQFVAAVQELRNSQINTAVSLRVDEGFTLEALITRESAEAMALKVGKEIYAFIKASSVILSTDEGLVTSARNQLWGEVSRIHEGGFDAEVTLMMSAGRSVTAVVTKEGLLASGLRLGGRASAIFEASSVVLATLGD